MSLNGKRDDFTRKDFLALETLSPLFTRKKINAWLDEAVEQVSGWRSLATDNAVPVSLIDEVESHLRLRW